MVNVKELRWEALPSRRGDKNWFNCTWETFRAKVPGGWFVLVMVETPEEASPSLTFYPDPGHAWDGGNSE